MRHKTKQQIYVDKQEIDNDVLLERINNLIETNKSEHKLLIEQTTKTNGSVARAVIEINDLKIWKGKLTGALLILNGIVWPIALYLFTKIF